MGLEGIGETGDRASEGQAPGVYGADFTVGSLERKGARGGLFLILIFLVSLII